MKKIIGHLHDTTRRGSFVVPVDGNYNVPPADVIETFWAFDRDANNVPIQDYDNMVLMYKLVDPDTFNVIPFSDGDLAKFVTVEMSLNWSSTQNHPHFLR